MSKETAKSKPEAEDKSIPDPEVKADQNKPRRYLTVSYKLEILKKAEACRGRVGEVGALLRREGLYSSHLSAWKKEQAQGTLSAMVETKRGRKKNLTDMEVENLKLKRENEKLRLERDQGLKLIEAQKKIAAIYETLSRESSLTKKPGKKG